MRIVTDPPTEFVIDTLGLRADLTEVYVRLLYQTVAPLPEVLVQGEHGRSIDWLRVLVTLRFGLPDLAEAVDAWLAVYPVIAPVAAPQVQAERLAFSFGLAPPS